MNIILNIAIILLKPISHYTYHQIQHSKILRFAQNVFMCCFHKFQNKQRSFLYILVLLTFRF